MIRRRAVSKRDIEEPAQIERVTADDPLWMSPRLSNGSNGIVADGDATNGELRAENERLRAELKAAQRRCAQLLAYSPAVIYGLRVEGEQLIPHTVSENIRELLGYAVEEALTAEWWFEHLHPEDRDRAVRASREGIARGSNRDEYRVRHKDGTYRWVEDTWRLVPGDASELADVIGVWCDITHRKKLEAEVALREQQFNAFFNNATAGMCMLDPELRYVQVNEGLARINGVPVEAHIGKTVSEVLPSLAPTVEPILRRVLATREPILNIEISAELPNEPGVMRHWSGAYFPMTRELGEPIGIGCFVVEVTERRRAEELLRRAEEHLRHAQKMEAIGQLAGGIAHDFNNIIGCIQGYTELVALDTPPGSDADDNIRQVLTAGRRAKDLVQQILTFSRQQEQERRPIELQAPIKEALDLLRASLPATIEVAISVAPDAPRVLADPTQIHQIIMNLATNAADAMNGRGKLMVELSSTNVDADEAHSNPDVPVGRYAVLSVSDTGCGMSTPTLRRAFEPFFTTKAPGEGTGLGLSVVHGIVKAHDGAIKIRSEPGKGTRFDIYFPEKGN